MEAPDDISAITAEPTSDLKYYYSKRNSPVDPIVQKPSPPLSRQTLQLGTDSTVYPPNALNGEMFEVGGFYEIDHEQLLPKSPIHLKDVRVVKVSEKTGLNVTVSFPSAFSLRKYFGEEKIPVGGEATAPLQHPELDEQFVMGFDRASKILRRLIPSAEVEGEVHLERFWLVAPKEEDERESIPLTAVADEQEEDEGGIIPAESCLLILKRSGAVGWGVRRKIKYIGRHREEGSSLGAVLKEEEMVAQCGAVGSKRIREIARKKKRKKEEKSFKKAKLDRGRASDRKVFKAPKDRWSSERYRAAELKLLEIMKEKGAVLGNPILRPELREEARKHIGDTGLLDHLLKHMAGKVVSEGKERFRRRHNPEGAMEYWLEAAELQELRRTAGVMDPFWLPPPGWKPGDTISPYGVVCGNEVELLKGELDDLRREIDWLRSLKLQEEVLDAQTRSDATSILELQESYESLTKSNARLEEQVTAMGRSLQAMQEELRLLKLEKERKDLEREREEKSAVAPGDDGERGGGGGGRMVRRSGFRICKPQGTFLWPNMAGGPGICPSAASGSSIMSSPSVVVAAEDPSGVPPTPHSASSATSPPRPTLLPVSPAAAAAPRAQVVVVAPRPHPPHQVLSVERTDSSDNLCPPSLPYHMKASSGSARGGAKAAAWEPGERSGGWSCTISTDLALSSPCYHR